jgi:hypothetical protein
MTSGSTPSSPGRSRGSGLRRAVLPLEGPLTRLSSWIDATYLKVRQGGRIVSVAVTIAVGVNTDGRREVLGMAIGASEAFGRWPSPFRTGLPHATACAAGSPA